MYKILSKSFIVLSLSSLSLTAFAQQLIVDNTTISSVVVNGGIGTVSPGSTCIQVAAVLPSNNGGTKACTSG